MDISEHAEALHKKGQELVRNGQYTQAISVLEDAAKIAPQWAYPPYDIAFSYLLQQQFDQALAYYKQTDDLEPDGFYTTKTAIWGLEKEISGVYPPGLYLAYAQVEWIREKDRKLAILKDISQKFPTYAPAWKGLGSELEHPDERLKAIESGLACPDIDLETKGGLLIDKALVTQLKGDTSSAKKQLESLLKSQSSISNRELAEFLLSTMAG